MVGRCAPNSPTSDELKPHVFIDWLRFDDAGRL